MKWNAITLYVLRGAARTRVHRRLATFGRQHRLTVQATMTLMKLNELLESKETNNAS